MTATAAAAKFFIEFDMGSYGPFTGPTAEAEARAFQRDRQLTGSSLVRVDPA